MITIKIVTNGPNAPKSNNNTNNNRNNTELAQKTVDSLILL